MFIESTGLSRDVCNSHSNSTRPCIVVATRTNFSWSILKDQSNTDDWHISPVADVTVLPWPQKSLSSPSTETVVISKSDVLTASCLVINALTVLDIVLSRRTKPWKFVLRILYRVGRSNLKWGLLWMVFQLWSQFDGNRTTDTIEVAARQLPFHFIIHQMQLIWSVAQTYPILLAATFLIYNIVVSWIIHRLNHRNEIMLNTSDGGNPATGPIAGGNRNVQRRIVSKWSLLIDCLFRPLSFDTAHSLVDFELDENVEFFIERLALPNLWLTPTVPTDYLKYLPVWRFDSWNQKVEESPSLKASPTQQSTVESGRFSPPRHSWNDDQPPSNMKWIPCADCAICLDKYRTTVDVCGLPCGHQFHHNCIMVWLQRDNHHCPICRWPAYQNKYLSIM